MFSHWRFKLFCVVPTRRNETPDEHVIGDDVEPVSVIELPEPEQRIRVVSPDDQVRAGPFGDQRL